MGVQFQLWYMELEDSTGDRKLQIWARASQHFPQHSPYIKYFYIVVWNFTLIRLQQVHHHISYSIATCFFGQRGDLDCEGIWITRGFELRGDLDCEGICITREPGCIVLVKFLASKNIFCILHSPVLCRLWRDSWIWSSLSRWTRNSRLYRGSNCAEGATVPNKIWRWKCTRFAL
jgi:hypothetical protein